MKKYRIYCAVYCMYLFLSTNTFALSQDDTMHGIKKNVLFSPISYNRFLGTTVNDNEYNIKEQLKEPPIKRIGIEVTGNYIGFVLYFTHNRVLTDIDPCGELYFEKEKISISSYIFGITFQHPIAFISNDLLFKFNIGFSSISLWGNGLEEKKGNLGLYFDAGIRYIFSSNSNYNLNLGVDFSHSESFSNYNENCYDLIGINGIYPYIGIMW